mmetsp:Transcript_31849/g.98385  ORF Transcript_31849/g.98385 Transcript_31849/m.98385 type:complete len:979 (-) Transcript_31849:198-3134(-)
MNESYWYQSRSELGGAAHLRRDVSEPAGETISRRFEGFSFIKQASTVGDLVATRMSAGMAPMPLLAWRLADDACTARDANPFELQPALSSRHRGRELLSSHFQATLVSPLFLGLNQTNRLDLVVDAILQAQTRGAVIPRAHSIHRAEAPEHDLGIPDGSKIAFKLMTPGEKILQARPVHRCASSRFKTPRFVLTQATTRLREAESSNTLRNLLNQHTSAKSEKDTSNEKRLGHFFYSLPAEHQRFLLAKQRRAIDMLERAQRKANKKTDRGFRQRMSRPSETKQNSSAISTASILSSTVRDPSKEQRRHNATLCSWLAVSHKHETQLAGRLQRIYRSHTLVRALRRHYIKKNASTDIQRSLRGQFGRCYADLLVKVANLAATSIAARYRIVIATRLSMERRMMQHAAAMQIQSWMRLCHACGYLAWMRLNWRHASNIDLATRRFLSHCERKLLVFRRSHLDASASPPCPFFESATARIAARLYGANCRSRSLSLLLAEIDHMVSHPARGLLLRIARGQIGRRITSHLKQEFEGAIEIQRIARGYMRVMWQKRVYIARLKTRSLIQLQKVARGHLDRIFARLKRIETWRVRLHMILLPRLQACVRRAAAKNIVRNRSLMVTSSAKIQHAWRQSSLRNEAKRAYHLRLFHIKACATTRLTRQLRGLIARKRYSSMRHAIAGNRFKSARIILRAWLRYRSVLRFAVLKGEWEIENSTKVLMAWHSLRNDVRLDMADVRADIKGTRISRRWTRKRLRALRNFITEAELRLPKIEFQMLTVGVADVEKGWREALENEWERLTAQLAMAVEEKRLMKIQAGRCHALLVNLQLEYEDIEVDIDDIAMREQEEFELLRRLEIRRADAHVDACWQKRVRHERMRWRVRDVRTRILRRDRKTMAELVEKALKRREIALSSTLSASKRQQILNNAMCEAFRNDRASRSAALDTASADKAGSMFKLRNSYDTVLSGCAAVLEGSTFGLGV